MKKTIQTSENKNHVIDLFPNLSEYPSDEDIINQLEKEVNVDFQYTSKKKKVIKIDKDFTWNKKKNLVK